MAEAAKEPDVVEQALAEEDNAVDLESELKTLCEEIENLRQRALQGGLVAAELGDIRKDFDDLAARVASHEAAGEIPPEECVSELRSIVERVRATLFN